MVRQSSAKAPTAVQIRFRPHFFMTISTETIIHLAELSKLEFDEKSTLQMKVDIMELLSFIDVIISVDTQNVAPLVHLNSNCKNIWRSDVPKPLNSKENILLNAPIHDSDYIKAPKVL